MSTVDRKVPRRRKARKKGHVELVGPKKQRSRPVLLRQCESGEAEFVPELWQDI